MLGFHPDMTTSECSDHADVLLKASSDPRVRKVCDWWQTPECMYAHSSKKGALWWGKHGGPPEYCKKLANLLSDYVAAPCDLAMKDGTPCFYCEQDLFSKKSDKADVAVISCVCSTWYLHVECRPEFTFPRCFKCNSVYTDCVESVSLSDIVHNPFA